MPIGLKLYAIFCAIELDSILPFLDIQGMNFSYVASVKMIYIYIITKYETPAFKNMETFS
jgi:hypothetical protein